MDGERDIALDRLARAPAGDVGAREASERDTLVRVAAAAAGAHGLDDVIELVADAACEAIGAGSLSIGRWERDTERMRILINVGTLGPWEERFPADETYALRDNPMIETLLRDAKPYFNSIDDPDAPPTSVALLSSLGKESEIGVPIVVNGEVWGEVWASTCPGEPRFRGRDVRFLEAIAGQLTAVVGRAELFTKVSRLAYEDPLTGLSNRRAFEEGLDAAVARARVSRAPLTLMLCDVDDLKAINDGRGHQAGDRALRRVGEALVAASATLPSALVGRLSGDEFAVLMEGSTLEAARHLSATALSILCSDRDVAISLSCGAAMAVRGAETAEGLLRAADTAQYAAKRRGGGQLCTAGAAAEPVQGPRRKTRRGAPDRLERATAQMTERLDGEYAQSATVDRLEVVMAGVAEAMNAAAWTISFALHGSPVIQSICASDDRDNHLRGVRVGLEDEVYNLADYPPTAALVGAGTGTFLVDRHDRAADPAERALLAKLGYSSVVAAAVSDLDGVYLLELYADADTADLGIARVRLSLLSRAATGRPLGRTERTDQLEKHTHQLLVSATLGERLNGLVDAGAIAEATVDGLFTALGISMCSVLRLDEAGELVIAAARGHAAERLLDEAWSQRASLGLIGRALRERDLVCVGDVRSEPDYRVTEETRDTRSEMCIPLFAGGELWGAIDMHHPAVEAFDADDGAFGRMVANQVGQALHAAGLHARLEGARPADLLT